MTTTPHDPILAPGALAALDAPQVLDVRWRLGGTRDEHHASYLAGHIPGAIFVDLEEVATGEHRPGAGRHPLPKPREFLDAIGRLGIDLGRPLVVVDDAQGTVAARVWWMLDALGASVYLLDGGIAAWTGPLCTEPCRSASLTPASGPVDWPEDSALDTEALARRLGEVALVDVREEERYLGRREPIDPLAGHIPTARSAPLSRLIRNGRFPTAEEGRALLSSVFGAPIVASCGSGVTACTLIAIARRAGIPAALATGSYSGWVEDPDRPVCTEPCGSLTHEQGNELSS